MKILKKMEKEKYEVIIPERRYIVFGLKEAGRVFKKYPNMGVSIRLMKEEELI